MSYAQSNFLAPLADEWIDENGVYHNWSFEQSLQILDQLDKNDHDTTTTTTTTNNNIQAALDQEDAVAGFDFFNDTIPIWQPSQAYQQNFVAVQAVNPNEMTPMEASMSTSPPEAMQTIQTQQAVVNSMPPAPTIPVQPASNVQPAARRRGRPPIIGRRPGESERTYNNRINQRKCRKRKDLRAEAEAMDEA